MPSRHSRLRRRLRAVEIVAAGAGMGVDDAERRRLGAQVHQNADQHRVLDDIGEVAGVKGVAIIHGRNSWTQIHGVKRCQSADNDAPDRFRDRRTGFGRRALARERGAAAAHRRHDDLVAAAGARSISGQARKRKVLAHADAHLAQPPAVAGHRDARRGSGRDWPSRRPPRPRPASPSAARSARYRPPESSPRRAPCARFRNRRSGSSPEQVPCLSHSLKIRRGAGIRSSIEETMLRSSRGAGRWQNSGKPFSYCGHSPCTTKE